jgi:hypothetical protein
VTPRNRSEFDEFCRRAFDLLRDANVRHLVIGGLAVVAVGEPRTTGDVDVIAFISDADASSLVRQAIAAGFEADAALEAERLAKTGTLRLRQGPFQLDIITASLPFEETAYQRAVHGQMFGRVVPLPTPEDLLLFKVLAGRDKDLLDAIGIVRRHASILDWTYVEGVLRELCDLAEDMTPWHRLQDVRARASG